MKNLYLAYNKQPSLLSDQQKSFKDDALSCYQFIDAIKQMGDGENKSKEQEVKTAASTKPIKDSPAKKSTK